MAIASFCLFALLASVAQAQHVVVVCPPETDKLLKEAFNRLRGELTMHGFEVEIETADEAVSPENLARRIESGHAVASISFTRNEGATTADIRIIDRASGKTSIRTIATPQGTEMASLLALRAVEILRASLDEAAPSAEAPKANTPPPPTAQPSPAPSVPAQNRPNPTPSPRAATHYSVTLRADALAAVELSDPSSAHGFGAALGVSKGPRLEWRLVFAAPWFGAEYATPRATAQVHLFSGSGEVAYSIPVGRRVQLQPLLAFGIAHLTTYTSTVLPVTLHSPSPSAWLAIPSLGLGLNVTLSTHWFWNTNARLAALMPRPVLDVDHERHKLGAPMAMFASGVGVKF
jgi:hypothetical protein